MRVIIAARLSQARTAQTGIDTQDVDARAWAERHQHEVVATVADKITGKVAPFDRPNLGPWLNDPVNRAKYEGIVVAKVDRLSRGRDWGTREWAEQHGKRLFVVSPELQWPPERGDTATPIVWDTLMNIASAEWENTSTRYRRMQQGLRDSGYLVGRPPFGYKATQRGEHKVLEPDQTTAPFVRLMADRYLAGDSLRQIADRLEAEGVPNSSGGSRWYAKSVQQVLRNPTYSGRRQNQARTRTLLKVDPILDRSTHQAVFVELARRANHRGRRAPSNTALLTSIAVCDKCGSPMYRSQSRGRLLYYRCHGREGRSECRNMVPLAALDAWVDAYMTQSPGGAFGHLEIIEVVTVTGHGHQDELADNSQDIRELDPDDPDYDARLSALRSERKRLQALPAVPDRVEERPTGRTVSDLWRSLTAIERRQYLLRAGVKVHVAGKGQWWMEGDPHKVMAAVRRDVR